MKDFILLLFLSLSFSVFSQDSLRNRQETKSVLKRFISLQTAEMAGIVLTKQDSLNFFIRGKDTLVVLTPEMELPTDNRVKVEFKLKDLKFLETYEDVVFGHQTYDNYSERTIKVWKDQVKVYFDESVPFHHRKTLMDFAKEISLGIDSLHISEVLKLEDSNYHIIYQQDSTSIDPEPRINARLGGYYISWNGKHEIYKGTLKLNSFITVSDSYRAHLLKWYFFKSLGYFTTSPLLPCSSFLSTCPEVAVVSKEDLELLKYHYSYSNCIGNNRDQFKNFQQNSRKRLMENPNVKIYVVHY